MANPMLLHRAIENVLRNALRFSPAGASVRLKTTLTAGGYGLGLAIAQRVVAAVDGEISAKNRPEGGFIVAIELPGRLASA